MNVVITGASRGIGLELTRIALESGARVMAVARDPRGSAGLNDLAGRHQDKLVFTKADLSEFSAAPAVASALADWTSVDLLINNAGVMRTGTAGDDFMESFKVNSVQPFLVTQALLPLLRKSRSPKVAHITSLMGSIADNGSGGYYAYRSSKTALNMINKSLALDNDWLTSVVLHPGWVKTDMGGDAAPVEPAASAKGLWKTLEKARSGSFYDYTGKELPW